MLRRSTFGFALMAILTQCLVMDSPFTTAFACPPETYIYYYPLAATNDSLLFCYRALLLIWLCSLALMLARAYGYVSITRTSRQFFHRASLALGCGQPESALKIAETYNGDPFARTMSDILRTGGSVNSRAVNENSFFYTAHSYVVEESKASLNRWLSTLQRLAFGALALGIIGTWLGLQEVVARTDDANILVPMENWTQWIDDYERLYFSAFDILIFSLVVALPVLLAHRSFSSKAKKLSSYIDSSCTELLNRFLKQGWEKPVSALSLATGGEEESRDRPTGADAGEASKAADVLRIATAIQV